MKNLKYNISESFNVVRWSLFSVIVSFVAVVGVYKYIDLSNSVSITFSSLETVYILLNDSISIVYIYLPLYLFTICGIMLDDNFGSLEVLKCGSRGKWLTNKFLTLVFYTIVFFIALFAINFIISSRVFPYSAKWSSDFVKMQVSMGQEVINYTSSPVTTISTSLFSLFLIYLFAGTISMFISLKTGKESLSLICSLVIGIAISILFIMVLASQKNISIYLIQNLILTLGICVAFLINYFTAKKKDFNMERRN